MKKILISLTALLVALALVPSLKAEQEYYIANGNGIQTVRDDPSHATCSYWAVWLGKAGANPAVSHGGEIWGKSAESVMKQLKHEQDFEVAYNKWIGSPSLHNDPNDTFFNPLGPICVMDHAFEAEPGAVQALDKIGTISDRISKMLFVAQPLLEQELGLRESNPGKPYYFLGPNVRQYFAQIGKAMKDFSKLYNAHTRLLGPSVEEINFALQQANQAVALAENGLPNIRAAFPGRYTPPSATGDWTQQVVSVLGANISQSVQRNGSQVQVRQSVVNDPNGQGQAYSFSAQSLNPSAISVQPQGAVWVVTMQSASRNVNMQITNGGGGVTNEVVSAIQLYFSSQAQAQAAANSFSQWAGH